jgi:hypothetical protein
MNNQLKTRLSSIGLALLASLTLASCGNKTEDTALKNAETPASASSPAGATSETQPYGTIPTSGATNTATSGTKVAIPSAAEKLGVKPTAETTCPSDAPVKGKVTQKRGNIYHAPKSPDFDKVKPDICFKDTATAEKAGFSVPK